MPSTEERIRQLVAENLEVDGRPIGESLDLNVGLADIGVSSMDIVAFAKVIQQEFNVAFTPQDCAELQTMADVIKFLDANAA